MKHSRTDPDEDRLFIVYVDGAQRTEIAGICDDAMQLTPALSLVRTNESLSRLYHRIKRHAHPRSLFVGPLEEQPKFKGMSEGALKWVRALEGVFEKT